MNIAAIRTFLAVVDTGNLNRASEILHVTQSTVTARLDALERTLGQTLLVRSRRGAILTKAGFAFLRSAELIVNTWESARSRAALPKGFSGLLSLGVHHDLWTGLGESLLEQARVLSPTIAVEVWPGDGPRIKRWLEGGLIDAALLAESVSGNGIASTRVYTDQIRQVSSVARDAMTWSDGYIMVDYGPEIRRQHANHWPENNTAHFTFASGDWALRHLLDHGGSAYLPVRLVSGLVSSGQLFLVRGVPVFQRSVFLSSREPSREEFPWLTEINLPAAELTNVDM